MFKYTFRILSSTKTLIVSPENAAQVLSPPQMIEHDMTSGSDKFDHLTGVGKGLGHG